MRHIISALLCLIGVHKWGAWQMLRASESPARFGHDWITIHVDHKWRPCVRCDHGYQLRLVKQPPAERRAADKEIGT